MNDNFLLESDHASEDDWSICSERIHDNDIDMRELPPFNPNTTERNTFEIFAIKLEQVKALQEKVDQLEQQISSKPVLKD